MDKKELTDKQLQFWIDHPDESPINPKVLSFLFKDNDWTFNILSRLLVWL